MGELIQDLKRELREEILQGMSYERQMTDEELSQVIDGKILEQMEREPMALRDRLRLQKELFDSFRRLDILQELVDDPGITEIMVNGPEEVFVETEGRIRRWEKSFESREQLLELIRQIVSRVNRTVNTASPIVDARLEDGSRVHVVLEPVALNGPILTIRKFPDPITMDRLLEYGSVTREAADLLKILAAARYNIFVSGGTGAGKTTFLNALSEFIPPEERVITIEDSAELQIHGIENLVRMEVRQADGDGVSNVTLRDLIRTSLRMRPDRIIVGEVRGEEALDMIQSMNTGHDGSLSTGHANSPQDMLSRLETMALFASDIPIQAIRKQIASSIDIIVQLERLRDRSRRVTAIAEVLDCTEDAYILNPIFEFHEQDNLVMESSSYGDIPERVVGQLERTGYHLMHRRKLHAAALESAEI